MTVPFRDRQVIAHPQRQRVPVHQADAGLGDVLDDHFERHRRHAGGPGGHLRDELARLPCAPPAVGQRMLMQPVLVLGRVGGRNGVQDWHGPFR